MRRTRHQIEPSVPRLPRETGMRTLRRFLHPAAALFLFLIHAGCSNSAQREPLFSARDSSGVQIWEYSKIPEINNAWTVSEHPILVLGQEAGEDPYLFTMVRNALRDGDGRIVIADGRSKEIRFFSADGKHLSTSGGEGEGPGEFTFLGEIFPYQSDSLAATNVFEQAVQVFDSEGLWSRTFRLQPPLGTLSGLFVEGTLPDGTLIVRAMQEFRTGSPEEGYHRALSTYRLYSGEGQAGQVLAELPGAEIQTINRNGRFMSLPLVMGRQAISEVVGGVAFLGVTDRLELRGYSSDGRMTTLLRVMAPPVPLDDQTKERWIEHALKDIDDPEIVRRNRQLLSERIWPDSLPVFTDLRGDSEGNLWVQRFAPEFSTEPAEWWVFGDDGEFLARASTPSGFSVHSIGSDFIIGVASDELGVERVLLYDLIKE